MPVSFLAGVAAIAVANALVTLDDGMCAVVTQTTGKDTAKFFSDLIGWVILTIGHPGSIPRLSEFFVYQTAFAVGQFGTGAMLGVILFVIMATVGIVQIVLLRTKE